METFIGREQELQDLKLFIGKKTASLIVVIGRRRVGKSRLIEEFASRNNLPFHLFMGLPPDKDVTSQMQRDEFARQLGLSNTHFNDWGDLLQILATKVATGKHLILLDEISWMAQDDPTFRGKLKNAWDTLFKKNPKLILVLCGSVSGWIEKNILESTGFLGRVSYTINLKELPLSDCNKFWQGSSGIVSPYEKLKLLSVTGGVPRYLEEVNVNLNAEENIKNLCFKKGGLLSEEFDHIFHDIFAKRSTIYKNLLINILDNSYLYEDIYKKLNIAKSGLITDYLGDLEKAGFIQRDFTWDIKTGKSSKLSKYRISDNYVRFYLKYINPNKDIIERGGFIYRTITSLPAWQSIMGLQFENLVLTNRKELQALLKIRPEDVIYDNPFFQTATRKRPGCQIDYMIQTRFDTLYACEIKFTKNPISSDVITKMQHKIQALQIPKRVSCRPVLIHVNGVTEDLLESGYFAHVIDFAELLTDIRLR